MMTGLGAGVAWPGTHLDPSLCPVLSSLPCQPSRHCPVLALSQPPSPTEIMETSEGLARVWGHQIHMRSASWGSYVNSSPRPIYVHLL